MIRFFPSKVIKSRVNISPNIAKPYKEQLLQARLVMDNYLKDKKCTISIQNSVFGGSDYLDIQAISDSKNRLSVISVSKNSETPFLRKIYKAVEKLANNVF